MSPVSISWVPLWSWPSWAAPPGSVAAPCGTPFAACDWLCLSCATGIFVVYVQLYIDSWTSDCKSRYPVILVVLDLLRDTIWGADHLRHYTLERLLLGIGYYLVLLSWLFYFIITGWFIPLIDIRIHLILCVWLVPLIFNISWFFHEISINHLVEIFFCFQEPKKPVSPSPLGGLAPNQTRITHPVVLLHISNQTPCS